MCNGKKTCWNCQLGNFIKGYPDTRLDPGMPDEIECQANMTELELEAMDINDKWAEFDKDAEGCKYYQSQVYDDCRNCGKPIVKAKYCYPKELLVYGIFDDNASAVCSHECKKEFEQKEQEYLDQEAEDNRLAEEWQRNHYMAVNNLTED